MYDSRDIKTSSILIQNQNLATLYGSTRSKQGLKLKATNKGSIPHPFQTNSDFRIREPRRFGIYIGLCPLFRLQRHRDEADDRGDNPDEAADRGGLDRVQRVADAAGDARHVLQGLQPHQRKGIPPR